MQGICGTPPTLFSVAAKLSSAVLSYTSEPRLAQLYLRRRCETIDHLVLLHKRKLTIVSLRWYTYAFFKLTATVQVQMPLSW